jgi:energy-coupling factor transporter ATP-binding protein EcfA2
VSASIGDELAARISTHPLGDEAGALVLAACEGEDALSDLLGGTVASSSRQPAAEPPPVEAEQGVFLKSISVEGFRGIGSKKSLTLQPGPGLTLVVGRNGSGKSSFAEALELLLTGSNHRWANRPMAWRKDWRNLHHPVRTGIEADFTVADHGPTTVARQWPTGTEVDEGEATAQHKGEPRGALSRLGWSEGLALYRPFLSYNELGSILDEGPSKLFDSIALVLGVDDIVAVAERLSAAGKLITDLEKSTKMAATQLAERLRDHDDPRAAAALAAIARRGGADLDAVKTVLAGADAAGTTEDLADLRRLSLLTGPDPAVVASTAEKLRLAGETVASVTGTDAGAARELASLLEAAIAHHRAHGDGDCPVCGNASTLDATWRDHAEAQVVQLRATAKTAEDAHRMLGGAVRAAHALVSAPPLVLGTGEAREAWEA